MTIKQFKIFKVSQCHNQLIYPVCEGWKAKRKQGVKYRILIRIFHTKCKAEASVKHIIKD